MNYGEIIDPCSPYTFSRIEKKIQNRTVLAAMTNMQSHKNGVISKSEIDWLVERAKGGFGIITTAATNVSIEGKAWNGEFGTYNDMHIPNLTNLTEQIHQFKSLVIAQLFHGGIKSPQNITGMIPISASALNCENSETGKCRQASINDIQRIIKDFQNAAIRCVESGFDGIEIHGAHGYLISQFLGTKSNIRTDEWGGDLENRSRFLIQIIKSIKKVVPENFIFGIRISPIIENIGINLNDTINLIGILKKLNLDFIHLSCWDVFSKLDFKKYKNKTLTEIILKSHTNLPAIISTGNVWSSLDAQRLMIQGADLVGVARVAIPYPFWASDISNKNYNPKKPPFSEDLLYKAKLSKKFIEYMKNWEGFVK